MSSFTFQRSGSAASLNSLLNSNNEFLIRVCPLCKESLDRWNDQMEQQNLRPDIVVLYEVSRDVFNIVPNLDPKHIGGNQAKLLIMYTVCCKLFSVSHILGLCFISLQSTGFKDLINVF